MTASSARDDQKPTSSEKKALLADLMDRICIAATNGPLHDEKNDLEKALNKFRQEYDVSKVAPSSIKNWVNKSPPPYKIPGLRFLRAFLHYLSRQEPSRICNSEQCTIAIETLNMVIDEAIISNIGEERQNWMDIVGYNAVELQNNLEFQRAYFSGTKLIFRRALEDTDRICTEVIKFEQKNDEIHFKYWFIAKGAPDPKNLRVNVGLVIPLADGFLLLGGHRTEDTKLTRIRSILVERKRGLNAETDPVQLGLLSSMHPADANPVAVRLVWVPIDERRSFTINVSGLETPQSHFMGFHGNYKECLNATKSRSSEVTEEYLLDVCDVLDGATNNDNNSSNERHVFSVLNKDLSPNRRRMFSNVKWNYIFETK
jgi:hypothetical protein